MMQTGHLQHVQSILITKSEDSQREIDKAGQNDN